VGGVVGADEPAAGNARRDLQSGIRLDRAVGNTDPSACHHGAELQHGWADAVSRVVCLGSPHLGADLEKGVNIAS
jgi:hypothetical protein